MSEDKTHAILVKCIFKNVHTFSKIKERLYNRFLDLRITFVSRFGSITYDHYLTEPKSMLEWKLIAMFERNYKIIYSIDYRNTTCNHPLF